MALIRNFRLPQGIGISADYIETFGIIQSTTPYTGAIVSRGGVGIGNSVSIGGRLQLFNGNNYTSFVSSASGNTVYTLPSSTPATGSSVLQSTSSGVMSWVPMTATGAASGFTTLNNLTAGIQYFSVGTSGNVFNISSSGSTHTFNIPIASSGSTGLVSTQSQTFAGQKTFTSAIVADLTGTATTATYSLQSGYGITSGTATTATYSHQSGYATTSGNSNTSGFATTATYSYQSGYGITSGLATTATYAHQAGYAITSGSSATATTATYSHQSGYGITAGTATTAQNINIANASTNSAHPLHFSPSATGTGLATSSNTTLFFNPSTNILSVSGLAVTAGTLSTSTSTGALIVTGGVGVGGTLYVASTITVNSGNNGLSFQKLVAGNYGAIYSTGIVPSATNYTLATDGAAVNFNGTGGVYFNISNSNKIQVTTNNVNIVPTAATSSSSTGAFTVAGGVGIGLSVSIGGSLLIFNGANYTGFRSSSTGNTVYTLPATTPSTGSSVLQSDTAGNLSWVAMVASGAASGSGITNLNSLTSGIQYFSTGTSGNIFNISSSGSTHTFNIPIAGTGSTGLVSTVTQSFAGVKTFTNDVIVSSTTGSTAYNTGSLTVYGGLGVSGQLSFNQAALGYTGASNPSIAFIGSTSSAPITLTVLSDNSLSFEGTSGKLFGINNNLSSGWIFNVGDISGLPLIRANADGTIAMAEYTANVGIGLSNPSYKLHVVGDTNLSSGYVYRINGTQVLSSTSLGTGVTNSSLTAVGTLSTGTWSATAISALYGGTGYNSYTKGDILVGAGSTFIKLNVGTDNYVLTASSSSSTGLTWSPTAATGITTINSLIATQQYFSTGASGTGFNISSSGSTHTFNIPIAGSGSTGLVSTQSQTFAGQKTFTSAIIGDLTGTATTAGFASTSTYSHQSGYAITSGIATTSINLSTIVASTNATHYVLFSPTNGGSGVAVSSDSGFTFNPSSNTMSLSTLSSTTVNTSTESITGSTASTSTSTGALVVTGGVGIGGSLYVASATAISGVTINAGVITGSLSGTATTAQNINVVNATTNSAHPIHFSPTANGSGLATSSNTSLSYNPSTLILSTSGLAITAGTASTNSTTGALVVTGGVGIGGSLFVNGDVTINGTTTTINSVTLTVDDKNIELGSVTSPSDVTAEGGGITLKGATDKSINWYTGTGWSSSESWNLNSGNTYKINNTSVLSSSTLGTGVTNSSLTSVGIIKSGTWSGSLITGLYGGTGYSNYTKGDLLVGAGSTLIKFGVGTDNQIIIASSSSGAGLSWATFANPTYGAFYSTSTQQVAGAGVSTPVNFNATYESNRVSIYGGSGTSSRIQIQDPGPFSITFSAQINLVSGNQSQKGDFWFRINGQDIPKSNSQMSITGKDYETLVTVNFVYTFALNDYFEIIMSSSDPNFSIEYQSGLTSPPRPDVPSIILSVLPITHIVGASGSGISGILSINGANVSQQYLLTGTSGSDFNITTVLGNHTFNIPIAGTGATGLLTSQAQTIGGIKTFASGIAVTSTTASSSTSTGALIVTGGVGIGGSLYVASATGISGVTINNGVVTGNLTGTASTATYSLQSGYGITAGTATTAQNINVVNATTNSAHPLHFSPSASGSGLATSSNTALSYNPSTLILSTSGLAITGGIASTNTTTGSLVVTGGVGIGQSVSIGGRLQLFNSSNYTAFVSSASGNTVYTLPATTPSTGSSVLQSTSAGVMSWVPLTAAGVAVSGSTDGTVQFKSGSSLGATNSLFFDTSLLGLRVSGFPGGASPSSSDAALKIEQTTGSFNGSLSGTMIAVNANTGFAGDLLNLEINAVSKFKIDNTGAIIQNIGTNSTSTTSGAVQIKGGVGITGAMYVGESVNATSLTPSTNTTSGSLIVSGGAGVSGALNVGGATRIYSSTASTNTSTGALLVTGGVGISGQLSFVTASLGFTGITTNPSMSFIGATSSSPITLTVQTDNSLNWEGSSGSLFSIDNNLSSGEIFAVSDISGLPVISASAGQTVTINEFGGYTQIGNGTINSSSTSSGVLVIAGGLGMTGNANIGGTVRISSGTNSASTSSGSLVVLGGLGITGNAFIGGTTTINGGTNSFSTTTGALVVNGGLGITGNANIGGTTRISSTVPSTSSTTGALSVAGGAGVGGTLFVGGNISNANYFYSGGNNFTKAGQAQGDILLDNNTNDTPGVLFYYKNNTNFGIDVYATGTGTTRYRIVRDLNESTGAEIWSIDRTGVVTRTAWDVGEVIASRVYNYTDLNMSATTTINSTTYTNVATITYTQKSSTSYLWIEFDANYDYSNGTTTDDFFSRITVGGSVISERNQIMVGQIGGGTRSGVIFPISGRYTNSATSGIAITVQARWGSADDPIRVYGSSTSGYMRIMEIGR